MKFKVDCGSPLMPPLEVPLSAQERADLQALQTAGQAAEVARQQARQQARDTLASFTTKPTPTLPDALAALKTLIQHLGADS